MNNKVKIYGFIKITEYGTYPYIVEDNEFLGRLITKGVMEWVNIKNGRSQRKNGPAMHTLDYSAQMWYQELYKGKHRLDGPQMICSSGEVEYWVNDKYVCNNANDFEKWLKLQIIQ